ncbi:MAG: tRNA (adenosine(37)-N6)-dimethylallyltransferase MiaA [Rickettsiales bacterium]|nr:tRNA (adenosine(37)-N6)-dimethylallyltransferase MiaA [Rickettsiales bacterium]
MKNKKIIVISGPTASGKSGLAVYLAKQLNGVILNADSMQIYKGLPILSAQPNNKVLLEVEHRLYNLLEPQESNSVFKWLELIKQNIDNILNKNQTPIIVGGTGMYISRFIDGIKEMPDSNEDLRNELNTLYDKIGWDDFYNIVKQVDEKSLINIKKNDKHKLIRIYEIYKISGKKLSYFENLPNKTLYDRDNIFHINIIPEREETYNSCNLRFTIMLEELNVIEEVKQFINVNKNVFNTNSSMLHTIGLMEIKDFIENKINYQQMYELSTKNTRNYAKRQFTWFRNQFKTLDILLNSVINKDNVEGILTKIVDKYENI